MVMDMKYQVAFERPYGGDCTVHKTRSAQSACRAIGLSGDFGAGKRCVQIVWACGVCEGAVIRGWVEMQLHVGVLATNGCC